MREYAPEKEAGLIDVDASQEQNACINELLLERFIPTFRINPNSPRFKLFA